MFKKLKNIGHANLTQLQAIKDQGEKQLSELKSVGESRALETIDEIRIKNDEEKVLVVKIMKIDIALDTAKFVSAKADGKTKYDFNIFTSPLKFTRTIHNYEITLDEAMRINRN